MLISSRTSFEQVAHPLSVHASKSLRWSFSCLFPSRLWRWHFRVNPYSLHPHHMIISVIYIKVCHIFDIKDLYCVYQILPSRLYVGNDFVHLCETFIFPLLWLVLKRLFYDVSGRLQGSSFPEKKKNIFVCESILSDKVHISSSMKFELFLWESTLTLINKPDTWNWRDCTFIFLIISLLSCHRDSGIV